MSLAAVNCKPCPNALARTMPFTACAGLDPGAFDPVRVSGQRTRAFNDSVAVLAPNAAVPRVAAQAVDGCARAPRQTGGPVWPEIPRSRDCIGGPCRVRHTGRLGEYRPRAVINFSRRPRLTIAPFLLRIKRAVANNRIGATDKGEQLIALQLGELDFSLMPMPPCCRAADRWPPQPPRRCQSRAFQRSLAGRS
jgi:hypothetical protein